VENLPQKYKGTKNLKNLRTFGEKGNPNEQDLRAVAGFPPSHHWYGQETDQSNCVCPNEIRSWGRHPFSRM